MGRVNYVEIKYDRTLALFTNIIPVILVALGHQFKTVFERNIQSLPLLQSVHFLKMHKIQKFENVDFEKILKKFEFWAGSKIEKMTMNVMASAGKIFSSFRFWSHYRNIERFEIISPLKFGNFCENFS